MLDTFVLKQYYDKFKSIDWNKGLDLKCYSERHGETNKRFILVSGKIANGEIRKIAEILYLKEMFTIYKAEYELTWY